MRACRTSPLPPSKSSSDRLTGIWRGRGPLAMLLLPLGLVYWFVAAIRRVLYGSGWLSIEPLPVPVVVIGNIIAGGAGKTPLTLWLAQRLKVAGRSPGIISRGYGRSGEAPQKVDAGMTAAQVGDEPLLLARRSGCPVFVGADRPAAGRALLAAHPECDVLLCDDGLQHYRLWRDVEIAVVDRRLFMNGWPLPAGPLREPPGRLASVDAVVLNGEVALNLEGAPLFSMQLLGFRFYRLDDPQQTCVPPDFSGKHVHALAGIGEPQRFFDHLLELGINFTPHAFPDHHVYDRKDLAFAGDALLMTEKDALKCAGLTDLPIWVLPVYADVKPDLARLVLEKINGCAPA